MVMNLKLFEYSLRPFPYLLYNFSIFSEQLKRDQMRGFNREVAGLECMHDRRIINVIS